MICIRRYVTNLESSEIFMMSSKEKNILKLIIINKKKLNG